MNTNQSAQQLWERARTLQAKGKLEQARRSLQKARKLAPEHGPLLLELGVLEGQMGQLDSATATLRKAASHAPRSADVHFNLAEALRASGQGSEAAQAYKRTLQIDPNYIEAEYGMGCLLIGEKQFDEALPLLEKVAARLPSDPEVQVNLAIAVSEVRDEREALRILLEVTRTAPNYLAGNLEFMRQLHENGRLNQLDRHLHDMAQRFDFANIIATHDSGDPNQINMLRLLADCFQETGRQDLATDVGTRLMRRKQTRADGATVLGHVAVQEGNFDKAEELFNVAIAADPNAASAMRQLATIKRLPESAEPILQELLAIESTATSAQRTSAGFALYHLLSNRGDYSPAFKALTAANTIRAEERPYSIEENELADDEKRQVFTPAFFQRRGHEGYEGEGCVFIVGMMRSGTTLTEQILAAHSKVFAGGERDDLMHINESLRFDMTKVPELPADWPYQIGRKLHENMFAEADGAQVATDKLPGNIDNLGLISFVLPRAKFIYCHRTPQDCALSIFEQHFDANVRLLSRTPGNSAQILFARADRQILDRNLQARRVRFGL